MTTLEKTIVATIICLIAGALTLVCTGVYWDSRREGTCRMECAPVASKVIEQACHCQNEKMGWNPHSMRGIPQWAP